MIYGVAAITALAQQCAPAIAAEALIPLIFAESGGNPLAININGGPHRRVHIMPGGAALARRYMKAGYSVDVGLAQINSANFARLGVTIQQAFNPCTNLRLSAYLLQQGYDLASRYYHGLDAISATYSVYNTGTLTRGFRNGYVSRIWSTANRLGSIATVPSLPAPSSKAIIAGAATANSDVWVFGQPVSDAVEVFK